ncbi:ribose-phosphate pyrophosphokinase 1 [Saitoella coloradoensis]
MRRTKIFSGTSHPELASQICNRLGVPVAEADLQKFANKETSVKVNCSVRNEDVFIIQSGSQTVNDHLMELLILAQACRGGSAKKVTAVLPYFPYSKQSKMKKHRGCITARMVANLLTIAGVDHIITMDLHASQMQGFFTRPVDNLYAEPSLARWIKDNIPEWREAVVVSKNPGGTKRATSLADTLGINFGIIHTDRRRGRNFNSGFSTRASTFGDDDMDEDEDEEDQQPDEDDCYPPPQKRNNDIADPDPTPPASLPNQFTHMSLSASHLSSMSFTSTGSPMRQRQIEGVHTGRLVSGHIVDDDYPDNMSEASTTHHFNRDGLDPMTASMYSIAPSAAGSVLALGGTIDAHGSDDEEENACQEGEERTITLVGDVRNKVAIVVDDMVDRGGSFVAAAEHLRRNCGATKVYVMGTHGVLSDDCLDEMEWCDDIHQVVVTNTYPVSEEKKKSKKLAVIDISMIIAESIRRNHNGESVSFLFGKGVEY